MQGFAHDHRGKKASPYIKICITFGGVRFSFPRQLVDGWKKAMTLSSLRTMHGILLQRSSHGHASRRAESYGPPYAAHDDYHETQTNNHTYRAVHIGVSPSQGLQLRDPRTDSGCTAAESIHDALQNLTTNPAPTNQSTSSRGDGHMLDGVAHGLYSASKHIDGESPQRKRPSDWVEFEGRIIAKETTDRRKDQCQQDLTTPDLVRPATTTGRARGPIWRPYG